MNLYHFTDLDIREDLKPGPNDWTDLLGFEPPPTVWLTRNPDPAALLFERPKELRFTVDLAPNSKRLVRWIDYLRKHRGRETIDNAIWQSAEERRGLENCYAYFGTVPFRWIKAIDRLNEAGTGINQS
jgi:hypothetical protein